MKRFLAAAAALCLLCGCGGDDDFVIIGLEQGYECPTEIKLAAGDYYDGKEVIFTEGKSSELSPDDYGAVIKYVNMTSSVGYGVLKSNVIALKNLCAAGYGDYRDSGDFSGKKAALYGGFSLGDYAPAADDCEYTVYTDFENLLSDIKEGAVDVVICTSDTAPEFKKADPKLRINDIIESDIYEYVVLSDDSGLITEVNKVIK
ncbi:MAG: transporter substrate-binding domain-containing protein [Clostridiales bacterium]|nr:transporter substrate-binding domain-containing protein [Clostridiales bacterium]